MSPKKKRSEISWESKLLGYVLGYEEFSFEGGGAVG